MNAYEFLLSSVAKLLYSLQNLCLRLFYFLWYRAVPAGSFQKIPETMSILLAEPPRISDRKSIESFCNGASSAGVKKLILFSSSSRELEIDSKLVSVKFLALKAPAIEKLQRSDSLGSFCLANSDPSSIQLLLFYSNVLNLFGLPPMSIANTEFANVSFCRPFSLLSLRYALEAYSGCRQNFGK